MRNNRLVKFKITHSRLRPKKYKFTHNFFWFKLDLDNIDNYPSKLVSYNKSGLYSFYDSDHLKVGKGSARENYIEYVKQNGVKSEITNVTIYTQLRFLGYVFNPVSFIFLKDREGREYAIIEIGNTFNELKPFFVNHTFFNEKGFVFKTKKYFYISPFINHDNDMIFRVQRKNDNIFISIDDLDKQGTMLKVNFIGTEKLVTTKNLINYTLRNPLVTFQFIFFIHLHAFFLWLKGIKYFKKNEHTDLQRKTQIWKK